MKKLYLVGGLAALTLTINAQNTDRSSYSAVPAQLEQCTKAFINADGTAAYAKGPGDVFWSEYPLDGALLTTMEWVTIGS
jgi:hypothetical protein